MKNAKYAVMGAGLVLAIGGSVNFAKAGTFYAAADVHEGILSKANQCTLKTPVLRVNVKSGYYSRKSLVALQAKNAFPNTTHVKLRRFGSSKVLVKFQPRIGALPLCVFLQENPKDGRNK